MVVRHHLRLAILHTECLNQCQKLSTFTQHSLGLCFAPTKPTFVEQRRTIVDKYTLLSTLPYNYPESYPYKEKGFYRFQIIPSRSKIRHHKNSKLIVVEGNIGSGKSKFAAKLADELGFHYMPCFSMNDILVDRYGNDMRKFHDLFPKRFRIPDELMFYQNPSDDQTAVMQDLIYTSRFEQYANALAHIFNTGEGVVLERSVYSDFVFANAMREKNWISMEFFKYYHFVRKVTLHYLRFWPHLVIYLDCPISKCLENIKKRGNEHEIANVDEKYLKTIEESYKDLLREFKRHSHILTYDWASPEYMDIVLDDIYNLNFDMFDAHTGEVLEEWFNIGDMDTHYGWIRYLMTEKRRLLFKAFYDLTRLHYEIAELYIYPPDAEHMRHVMMFEVLKSLYTYGYTEKDPITREGMLHWRQDQLTPEKWFEYFWKEWWFSGLNLPIVQQFDPTGKMYDPDYLRHH